ncbi:lysophospholipid acyltransferase family protein [Roseibacterium sp. SDUM158017]|uniref:lysophospholipid acyltransferase family protein n=1 Tax=Roseicyclus salinarum TaxID=3036773 RepID=UPI002414EFBA|nr:lysophospholipid acyltransferase family protein [Roseibacterium sp. SDUM158017]MDG4648617.1 lysophospholipid acyltransferase family protein [Roseibacterium sp. SDUM158017]
MTTTRAPFPLRTLLRPKNWPLLLLTGAGRAVALLPMRAMPALSRPLAWGLWRWRKFRHVTRANLRACLPGLPAERREAIARASTREVAASLLVSLKTWFGYRPGHPDFEARFVGLEHFEAARDTGRGIILLNFHSGSTELNGVFTAQLPRGPRRFTGLYRAPSDDAADAVLRWARTGFCDRILPATDIRAIARGLKDGDVTWFATDLEFSGRGSVWADFFGVPAATSNSLARIAKMSNALVLPARLARDPKTGRHRLEVFPPLRDFPTGDAVSDATAMNAAIAALVTEAPEPYWWCLERFRRRPPGASEIY